MKIIDIMTVTTIPISKEFHDWLKSKGKKGESYEDVIKRLLNQEYKGEIEEKEKAVETDKIEEKAKRHTKAKHSKEKPKKPELEEQQAEPQTEEKSTQDSVKKRLSEVFGVTEEKKEEENKEDQAEEEGTSNEEEDILC